MKKRNHFLLSETNVALFKEDPALDPTSDDTTGGGTAASATEPDFVMISGSEKCPGCEVNYSEFVLDGSGGANPRPINEEDEPERVVLVMDLPKPESTWTMRLILDDGKGKDKVDLETIEGIYEELYHQKTAKFELVHEEKGRFFTIKKAENNFQTFLNINDPERVTQIKHDFEDSFDRFRVSFLALTK
ncbi:MAG: hypothetical protein AAF570_21775 [Bacteroidota bacterium]